MTSRKSPSIHPKPTVELAYRIPGEPFKRASFTSRKKLVAFCDKLEEKHGKCIEYRYSGDLEVLDQAD